MKLNTLLATVLSTITLSVCCRTTNAQHLGTYRLQCSNCLSIKATPTTLANRYSSELPIGLEYGFGKDAAVILEAGIPLNGAIHKKGKDSYRYDYLLRTEVRLYFGYYKNAKWHIGLEGFTKQQAYHETNGGYMVTEGYSVDYSYAAADVQKRVVGGDIKLGVCSRVFANLFLDFYVGIGAKSVSIDRDNIKDLRGPEKATRFFIYAHNEDDVPDQATLAYFPVGVTLSWQLGKLQE